MTSDAPIGVFDSGIGGLTVVREIARQLPNESIVYFGDTARVPYGPKSPDTVLRYSREITTYLRDQGVKAVVVACNTATAHALPALQAEYALPIVGVVDPGARAAVEASTAGEIGVIGTAGTVRSGAYERAIHRIAPTMHVTARACPLFVPLVEEGWLDTEPTRLIAREYLAPLAAAQIDTLVLGCTHYPLLKPLLAALLGPCVRLIDSAEKTAEQIGQRLIEHGIAARAGSTPRHRFIASDAPEQFLRVGQQFLGTSIDAVETVTLG